MSAGITVSQAADLLITTLGKMPKGQYTDTFKYQDYPLNRRIANDNVRRASGGTRYEMRVRLRENLSARGVDLYEATPNLRVSVMDKMTAEWCHAEAKVHYDVRELMMNSDPEAVVNWIETQRAAAFESLANFWEYEGFLTPLNSTDTKRPLGLPFWIRTLGTGVTDTVGGFNGITALYRNSGSTSSPGGIDASVADNNRWRNWVATCRGMNPQTLDLLRVGLRRVRFNPPPKNSQKGKTDTGSGFCFYWPMQYADEYERLVNAGPDDRRGDANPLKNGDNNLPFRGVDTCAVPVLDDVSYLPIYGVNHRHLYMVTLKSQWMVEDKPINDRSQRHVFTVGIDCSAQIVCDNPRSCMVVHQPR